MDSYDLIDSVLQIGDNDLSNGLFVNRFNTFYKRQFGPHGLRFTGAKLIYMFYGAFLSLPLTEKLAKHDADAILVARKRNNKLLVMISRVTLDNSMSLKLICFDDSTRSNIPFIGQPMVSYARTLLEQVKGRPIFPSEMRLSEIHWVTFEHNIDQVPSTLRPKIAKMPFNIQEMSANTPPVPSDFILVRQGQYAESASLFAKQLHSESYDVVKYNCHAFIKLLMSHHQVATTKIMQLSSNAQDVYLFLIGALEMNWARTSELNVFPVFKNFGGPMHGIVVSPIVDKSVWKPKTTTFVVQLLTSAISPRQSNYVEAMYNEMVRKLPHFQSKKVVSIGIEYNKLLQETTSSVNVASFEFLPFTFLLDANPLDNIVDILLNPYTEVTLPRINYCIRNLNQKGMFGLHAYLYGQLMSYTKYDIEKYIFHGGPDQQGRTTLAFKLRGTESAVVFDILQTSLYESTSTETLSIFDYNHVSADLNVKTLLRVSVHQTLRIDESQMPRVHLIYSRAELIENTPSTELVPRGSWLPIPTIDPNEVLIKLDRRPETFKQLSMLDTMHIMFDSIDSSLLKFQGRMNFQDIVHFISGVFSDWSKIFYNNYLGILKSDGSPLFISSLQSTTSEQELASTEALRLITSKYVRFDYVTNPLRRMAAFVCITRSSENGNKFGVAKLSSYREHRSMFESCLRYSRVRTKRKLSAKIPCLDDLSKNFVAKDVLHEDYEQKMKADDIEKPPENIQMKIQPYLETIDKVSKAIMTAQIFKDMISALIRGDYKSFAVNTAFLASGPLLECLSMKMIAKGTSMGSSFIGKTIVTTAPFLGRLPIMGFVGFDLYEQAQSYKNGNKGAIVNIAGDSAILTIDFATASLEGAEALGIVSGVADVAGPVGFAIGTAIFVGVDIYTSVKAVKTIDAMVHLTSWQKFTTGLLSFLHISPTKTVQKEIFEKNVADASIDSAANFFSNHSAVRYYIFPSYQENGQFSENNVIDLTSYVTRWAHSWPKIMANTKLICAGDSELPVEKSSKLVLNCSNSFGYESLSENDNAVILLANGNDSVVTFRDHPTTFLVGNGRKYIMGSSKDDLFILEGNDTSGYINGLSGKNTLNLANFSPIYALEIDFLKRRLTYADRKVVLYHIHNVIGRPSAQEVIVSRCHTRYLDTQGGSALHPDTVILRKQCEYDVTIRIFGNLRIENKAAQGTIKYILSETFNATISGSCATNASNMLLFEHDLEDVNEILLRGITSNCYDVVFKIGQNNALKLEKISDGAIYIFRDESELRINNGTVTANSVSNDTEDIIHEKYSTLAKKLNAVFNVYSKLKNISILFGSGMNIRRGNATYNHINILPNDPYHETYLVGGQNQNVFRISMPHIHKTTVCRLKRMPPVTIKNYFLNDSMNVVDLYEIVLLIHEQHSGRVTVGVESRDSDLLMKVYGKCPNDQITNIINITLHKALENENYYKHVVVNMRRPMTIIRVRNLLTLAPVDYRIHPNETHTVIHRSLVEPYTTIVSQRLLGKYEIAVYNGINLMLTNAKHADQNNWIFVIFVDYLHFEELLTLRLVFPDQAIDFSREIAEVKKDEIQDFEYIFGVEKE